MPRVLGTNGASVAGVPRTKNYRPSWGGLPAWAGQGRNWQVFHLGIVDVMAYDSTIALGTAMIETPIIRHEGQWQVQAVSPDIQVFVESTLNRFWKRSIRSALSCAKFGFSGAEAIYNFDDDGHLAFSGLKPLHQRDISAGRNKNTGEFGGLFVKSGDVNMELNAASGPVPAKGFWCYYGSEYNSFYGRSRYVSAYPHWRDKNGTDGCLDIIRMWYYKNAYSGLVIRHPDKDMLINGQYIPCRDMARQIAETLKTGGVAAVPSTVNPRTGKDEWVIEYPHMNGNAEGLLDYLHVLDDQMMRGLGIPDDVITGGSGGYSGRKVPEDAFYTMEEDLLHAITVPLVDQIIAPLVRYNFGKGDLFEITWRPMLPGRQQLEGQQAIGANAIGGGGGGQQQKGTPMADLLAKAMGGQQKPPGGEPGQAQAPENRTEQVGMSLIRMSVDPYSVSAVQAGNKWHVVNSDVEAKGGVIATYKGSDAEALANDHIDKIQKGELPPVSGPRDSTYLGAHYDKESGDTHHHFDEGGPYNAIVTSKGISLPSPSGSGRGERESLESYRIRIADDRKRMGYQRDQMNKVLSSSHKENSDIRYGRWQSSKQDREKALASNLGSSEGRKQVEENLEKNLPPETLERVKKAAESGGTLSEEDQAQMRAAATGGSKVDINDLEDAVGQASEKAGLVGKKADLAKEMTSKQVSESLAAQKAGGYKDAGDEDFHASAKKKILMKGNEPAATPPEVGAGTTPPVPPVTPQTQTAAPPPVPPTPPTPPTPPVQQTPPTPEAKTEPVPPTPEAKTKTSVQPPTPEAKTEPVPTTRKTKKATTVLGKRSETKKILNKDFVADIQTPDVSADVPIESQTPNVFTPEQTEPEQTEPEQTEPEQTESAWHTQTTDVSDVGGGTQTTDVSDVGGGTQQMQDVVMPEPEHIPSAIPADHLTDQLKAKISAATSSGSADLTDQERREYAEHLGFRGMSYNGNLTADAIKNGQHSLVGADGRVYTANRIGQDGNVWRFYDNNGRPVSFVEFHNGRRYQHLSGMSMSRDRDGNIVRHDVDGNSYHVDANGNLIDRRSGEAVPSHEMFNGARHRWISSLSNEARRTIEATKSLLRSGNHREVSNDPVHSVGATLLGSKNAAVILSHHIPESGSEDEENLGELMNVASQSGMSVGRARMSDGTSHIIVGHSQETVRRVGRFLTQDPNDVRNADFRSVLQEIGMRPEDAHGVAADLRRVQVFRDEVGEEIDMLRKSARGVDRAAIAKARADAERVARKAADEKKNKDYMMMIMMMAMAGMGGHGGMMSMLPMLGMLLFMSNKREVEDVTPDDIPDIKPKFVMEFAGRSRRQIQNDVAEVIRDVSGQPQQTPPGGQTPPAPDGQTPPAPDGQTPPLKEYDGKGLSPGEHYNNVIKMHDEYFADDGHMAKHFQAANRGEKLTKEKFREHMRYLKNIAKAIAGGIDNEDDLKRLGGKLDDGDIEGALGGDKLSKSNLLHYIASSGDVFARKIYGELGIKGDNASYGKLNRLVHVMSNYAKDYAKQSEVMPTFDDKDADDTFGKTGQRTQVSPDTDQSDGGEAKSRGGGKAKKSPTDHWRDILTMHSESIDSGDSLAGEVTSPQEMMEKFDAHIKYIGQLGKSFVGAIDNERYLDSLGHFKASDIEGVSRGDRKSIDRLLYDVASGTSPGPSIAEALGLQKKKKFVGDNDAYQRLVKFTRSLSDNVKEQAEVATQILGEPGLEDDQANSGNEKSVELSYPPRRGIPENIRMSIIALAIKEDMSGRGSLTQHERETLDFMRKAYRSVK